MSKEFEQQSEGEEKDNPLDTLKSWLGSHKITSESAQATREQVDTFYGSDVTTALGSEVRMGITARENPNGEQNVFLHPYIDEPLDLKSRTNDERIRNLNWSFWQNMSSPNQSTLSTDLVFLPSAYFSSLDEALRDFCEANNADYIGTLQPLKE